MNETELRIGNWIQCETYRPYQIRAHNFTPDEDGNNECLALSIPIRLSREWLLKLGFKEFQKDSFCIKIGESHFIECHGGKVQFTSADSAYGKILSHIQSIHQLQNLYFALTGQELNMLDK